MTENLSSHHAEWSQLGQRVSPQRLGIYPGDEATFACSVEEPDGVFTWITNATSETCRVFSSQPQSQCGQFIGQLQNSSLSTLTATSAATRDTGNILIQCYYITDLVGSSTLYISGKFISSISVYGMCAVTYC